MPAARNVLESQEVRQAIEEHGKSPTDNLTEEQREYMEFIKRLDAKSAKNDDSHHRDDAVHQSDNA